jgi:DNA-directed RNA polymerase subunit K/omega
MTMFLGRPDQPARARTLQSGEPGDLCVLSVPPEAALNELDAGMVAATIVGGQIAYAAE